MGGTVHRRLRYVFSMNRVRFMTFLPVIPRKAGDPEMLGFAAGVNAEWREESRFWNRFPM
jgi:hypothetical protein